MRRDYPDYKTPLFAYFRAFAAWTVVLVVVAVILVASNPPAGVVDGIFIALLVAGLASAFVTTRRIGGEEKRVQRVEQGERAAAAAPSPNLRVVILSAAIRISAGLGILLLLVGLIAHVTGLAVAGAVLFALFLFVTAILGPVLHWHRSQGRAARAARRPP